MKRTYLLLTASFFLFAAGCATSDGTKPDDMSVKSHRAAADQERKTAQGHEAQYDPDATTESSRDPTGAGGAVSGVNTDNWGDDAYNPTETHRTMAEHHLELAKAHDAAAKQLVDFEEKECQAFTEKTRSSCPLLGSVSTTTDIDGGIRLQIVEGVPVNAVAGHVRCHFAFARTQGYEGMDACPLYMKGVTVRQGDGYVDLLVKDGGLVSELRKRARMHALPAPG